MNDVIFRNRGYWWPAYEKNPEKAFNEIERGMASAITVSKLCPRKRLCVQAGGHVGLVPIALSTQFSMVITFEAQDLLYDCMVKNLAAGGVKNVHPIKGALGDMGGVSVKLRAHRNSGVWRVDENGTVAVDQHTIDSLKLNVCDAIILDVEGYEPKVLRGAFETIHRCQPTIQCEMLPRSAGYISYALHEIGYRCVSPGRDAVFMPC